MKVIFLNINTEYVSSKVVELPAASVYLPSLQYIISLETKQHSDSLPFVTSISASNII